MITELMCMVLKYLSITHNDRVNVCDCKELRFTPRYLSINKLKINNYDRSSKP